MGRYTTVQSYSDSNANLRAVPYDQARGAGGAAAASGSGSGAAAAAASSSGGAPPPPPPSSGAVGDQSSVRADKVHNPYGSTAGAGSGEFHIYRHARSREMARLKGLDEAEAEQRAEEEFKNKIESWKSEEEKRTEKRRKKRKREKEARERKKNLRLGGIVGNGNGDGTSGTKQQGGADVDDEFEYTPMQQQSPAAGGHQEDENDGKVPAKEDGPSSEEQSGDTETAPPGVSALPAVPFANDGSFLEMMKRKLVEEQEAAAAAAGNAAKSGEAGGDDDSDSAKRECEAREEGGADAPVAPQNSGE